jgi:hypothetical protein
MDMEEDTEILALLLKHMSSCIDAADIEQLVREMREQLVREISVLDTPLPTRSGTGATAAGSTRWTSGCGAMAGAAPGWCLLRRRRGSGPRGSARAGPGRQRRGSVAARPLPQRGRRQAAAERSELPVMISCMISYALSYHMYSRYHAWYHTQLHVISYNFGHSTATVGMLP